MEQIMISIIIPVYNTEKYIGKCIESILRQTNSNYEIILVDDGSIDKSGEICDKFANIFKNIKVIHKENGGLSDARNTGLACATGEYVVFLDSDDYWAEKKFLEKAEIILSNRKVDLIVFGYKKVYEGKSLSKFVPKTTKQDISFAELVKNGDFNICAWDKIVKRNLLTENRIVFRKRVFSEDMEWCAKIFSHINTCAVLKGTPYAYTQRSGSITKSITSKNIEDVIRNYEVCKNYRKVLDIEKKQLYDIYLSKNISMLLIAITQLKKREQKKYFNFLKKNIYILRKGTGRRETIIYITVKFFGLKITIRLLGFLYWIRKVKRH